MLFSLGFLIAMLGAVAIVPAFWHRALKLSTRRLEMQLPLSAREVLAGRDLLRAELAVEQRRLEQKVEALGAIHARDMAELGRRTVAIAAKDAELETLRARSATLETEKAELLRALADTEATLDATAREVDETTAALDDARARGDRKLAEVHDLEHRIEVLQKLCANQRIALTALEQDLLHERETRTLETVRVARLDDELSGLQVEHDAALARLELAEAEIADLERRVSPAERQRIATAAAKPDPAVPKAASLGSDETLRREIDRVYEDLVAYHERLYSGSASQERGRAAGRSPTDEQAQLRKRISAIGAKVARMAEPIATERKASDDPAPIAVTEPEA